MDTGTWATIKALDLPQFPRTTDFFFWSYDDGTEAAVAIDQDSKEEIYSKIFDDKAARKQYQERIQVQNEKKELNFEKNKLSIKSGLKYAESSVGNLREIAATAKPHLLHMLEACGQDLEARTQMVQLFSALLAGYYFTFLSVNEIFPVDEPAICAAPILTCKLKDGVNDLLRGVVDSLCINTVSSKWDYGKLIYTQPCCLPASVTDKKILDCAYIELGCSSHKKFPAYYPAQYRETGVFLNTRFFPGTDILRFQKRNRWAALVLYGAKDQSLLTDPIRLDSTILSQYTYQYSWDRSSICVFILHFVNWLTHRHGKDNICTYYGQRLQKYLQMIRQHNQKRGSIKIRKLKCLWLETNVIKLVDAVQ